MIRELVRTAASFFIGKLMLVPFSVSLLFVAYLGFATKGRTLFVHDSSLYLTKSEAIAHFGSLWRSDSFGYADYLAQSVTFFSNVLSSMTLVAGMTFSYSQLLIFLVILLSVWYGSWYAFRKAFERLDLHETFSASFFASVLYTFNLYMIASWHGGTMVSLFIIYVAAPLILLLLIELLCHSWDTRKTVALALCVGISFNTAPYAMAILIAFSLPFLLLQKKKNLVKNAKAIAAVGGVSLLVSTVFILLLSFSYLYSDPHPIRNNLVSYAFPDFGLRGTFRLFFEWTMDRFWGGRYFHSYYPYYNQWIVIVSAFVLWFSGFFSFIRSFVTGHDSKSRSAVVFSFLIVLVGIFISKADQEPFGDWNMFLYEHIPLFNMFRTPDTKFGLPVLSALSFLVGYFLATSKNLAMRSVVVIAIVLQVLPFFSLTPLVEVRSGDEFQRVMNIPDAYFAIKAHVDDDKETGAVFFLPGTSYTNFDYKNGTGLNGQDILGKMIDRPIAYGDNFIFGKSEKVYASILKDPRSVRFDEYGIRYVLVRKDILHGDTADFSSDMDRNETMEKVYESDLGDLYRIKESLSSPVIVLQSDSASIQADFKPDSSVQTIEIKNLKGDAELSFLQSFHPGWKVYPGTIGCQTCLLWNRFVFDDTHHFIENYANGWTIDSDRIRKNFPKDAYTENPDGSINVTMTLYFKPQAYFYFGLFVSFGAVFLCFVYLGWNRYRRRRLAIGGSGMNDK